MVSEQFRSHQTRMAAALAAAPQASTLQERRDRLETAMGNQPLAEGIRAEEMDAAGVPVIACSPAAGAEAPSFLYFHGGGYRMGSARASRAFGSYLALACSARVLLVDYRLAPENPFPAAVDDAVRTYRWVVENGILPRRVLFGGDSAGGGLAASLMLAVRDAGLPLPAGAVCLSPWADLTNRADSFTRCALSDSLFSKDAADEASDLYLQGADPEHPLASPVFGDWEGLPPLFVQSSRDEVLADDAILLANVADNAGVEVELHLYAGMPHVWQTSFPAFPEAVQAVEQVAAFVARVTASA